MGRMIKRLRVLLRGNALRTDVGARALLGLSKRLAALDNACELLAKFHQISPNMNAQAATQCASGNRAITAITSSAKQSAAATGRAKPSATLA